LAFFVLNGDLTSQYITTTHVFSSDTHFSAIEQKNRLQIFDTNLAIVGLSTQWGIKYHTLWFQATTSNDQLTFTSFSSESKLMGPYDVASNTGNVDLREIIGGKYVAYLDGSNNRLRAFRACGGNEYYDSGTCKQCASGQFTLEIEETSCRSCDSDSFSTWACGGGSPYITSNPDNTESSISSTTYTPPAPVVPTIPTVVQHPDIISNLASLKGEMDFWDGVFSAGTAFVLFNLAVHYFKDG